MSAYKGKPILRRAKSSHRIMKRIARALGPFTPREILLFNPQEGLSTLEETQSKDGRLTIRSKGKAGFFESLYTKEIPRSLQRAFWMLDDDGPPPTPLEYRKMEREILGYARRKLFRELVSRITKLPPRAGRQGGRRPDIDTTERRRIQENVKNLMDSGNKGEGMSKRKAIEVVAGERGFSERHIWRIVLGH